MKQETNNEMDLLLRRLGRRDDAAVPEDHLDADELSAYAENALPAAARTRYTVHLAECSRCRSLVAQLSSSAGVIATTESAAVPEPSGFRKFLASLFTPMVLRYAAPALGLIVVAAIGFVVLRRNQAERYVAQNTGSDTRQQPVASPEAPSVDRYNYSLSNTAPSPGRLDESKKQTNQPAQPAPAPNAAPAVTSVETEVSKDKAVSQPKLEEQAAAANEPPPVKVAPTPAPEQSPRAAEPEVARNEVKEQPVAGREAKKDLRVAERDDKDSFARARKPADSVSATAPASGAGRRIQVDGADDTMANTRTVAGRRFRKQGGVWVDTAYDSSKDAVTLSRGSEQYRALVADEPAIKTIADQLEGEIIVVWKGHTYRIR